MYWDRAKDAALKDEINEASKRVAEIVEFAMSRHLERLLKEGLENRVEFKSTLAGRGSLDPREPSLADSLEDELKLWCRALRTYEGRLFDDLLYLTLNRMRPLLKRCVSKGISFDAVKACQDISAALGNCNELEVASKLLCELTHEGNLGKASESSLSSVVHSLQARYPGLTMDLH